MTPFTVIGPLLQLKMPPSNPVPKSILLEMLCGLLESLVMLELFGLVIEFPDTEKDPDPVAKVMLLTVKDAISFTDVKRVEPLKIKFFPLVGMRFATQFAGEDQSLLDPSPYHMISAVGEIFCCIEITAFLKSKIFIL